MTPHPLSPLAEAPNGLAWLLLAIVAVLLIMPLASGPTEPNPPRRIVCLELARTRARADEIVRDWETRGLLEQARHTVLWDFAFIPAYAAALALACLLVAGGFGPEARTCALLLRAAAWLPLLAGLLDLVENLALVPMLYCTPVVSPWPEIAFACAVPKFLLVGVTAVSLVLGAVATVAFRAGGTHAP